MYIYAYIYTNAYIKMYLYMYAHMHIHIYTHIYTYTYTYAYTCINIHVCITSTNISSAAANTTPTPREFQMAPLLPPPPPPATPKAPMAYVPLPFSLFPSNLKA